MCAGADAVVGYVCQSTLDPGDEVVTGWPSFPSYVLDPLKLGAVPVRVPLRDERIDLDALLAAITPRTKLVFVAAPNNPTGTTNSRAELDAYFERVPPHVLTVLDQAYFEYVVGDDYPDAVSEYFDAGAAYSCCARSRRSSASPACGSATESARRTSSPRSARCDAPSTSRRSARRLRSRASATRPRSRGAATRTRSRSPSSGDVLSRARLRGGGAGRRELLLRPRRRRRRAQRRAAAARRHRPSDGPFGAPDALRITAGTLDEVAFLGCGARRDPRAARRLRRVKRSRSS